MPGGTALSAHIVEQSSYCDQVFRAETSAGRKCIFKIANSEESKPVLSFQQEALLHVQQTAPTIRCPRLIKTLDGGNSVTVFDASTEREHVAWMLSFLPGRFISALHEHTPDLLVSLGRFMGELDTALSSFSDPAMHRVLQWDLKNATALDAYLPDLSDEEQRTLVHHFLDRFKQVVRPKLERMRMSVVHNDANDNNVLVHESPEGVEVDGIIDFGDMVYTYTVCEAAIAMAYMTMGKEDLLHSACAILKGYQERYPLTVEEVGLLFDLICIRLCTSVCMSARQRKYEPDVAYLAISEQPAWDTLERLIDIKPDQATEAFMETTQGIHQERNPRAQEARNR